MRETPEKRSDRPGRDAGGRRTALRLWLLALWAACCVAAASEPGAPGGRRADAVQPVSIADPKGHWADPGYAEMVPSVRLPTTHDHNDVIRVYLRVPPGREIHARYLPAQKRYTLEFPAGTQSDRGEYLRYSTAGGGTALTVVDVRGTRIGADGRQRFHSLRPVTGEPGAPLLGWSWPAGDEQAQAEATRRIEELAARADTPVEEPPLTGADLGALVRLNDCGRCHIPNHRRETSTAAAPLPRRETDASGFYLPLSVLDDEAALAATRPLELNAADPYVTVRCGERPALLFRDDEGWVRFRCPDSRVPVGRRDVAAGVAAGDPYTLRVCRARRYLYDHMDDAARAAFADSFRACAIP